MSSLRIERTTGHLLFFLLALSAYCSLFSFVFFFFALSEFPQVNMTLSS